MTAHYILLGCTVLFTLLILAVLIRAILGPRFTDRMVSINVLGSMVVAVISILGVWLKEDYLVDVALVYTLLSFLTVVVLSRIVLPRYKKKRKERSREGRL